MYHQYFGLTEAPFSIAVNPRYLFMSARHRDALAHLLYGVGAGGGFILLTGEVGTGKTTINRCLLEQLPPDTDIAIILNPALNAIELLATACDELGISYDPDKYTLKTLTDKLHSYLLHNHSRGRKTVLMIDEAQHLDFNVLEQIRLLTNLETNSEKLLQIILIGQPELAQLLSRPELRQLNQRITARYNLEPLNRLETAAYIAHRLQVAGMVAGREVFPPRVVAGIYRRTRGIPRLINVLCDRILLGAYGRNKQRADMKMLRLATKEVMGQEQLPYWTHWRGAAAAVTVLCAVTMMSAAAFFGWYEPAQERVLEPLEGSSAERLEQAAPVRRVESTASAALLGGNLRQGNSSDSDTWLLPPATAVALLWQLSGAPLMRDYSSVRNCEGRVVAGLACIEGSAVTWDEIVSLNRPLLLNMVTPERFSATTLLLEIEGRMAWVASAQGALKIELQSLSAYWSGTYQLLWHPPQGFDQPVSLGDKGQAVAEIGRLFAQLDGQQAPLADSKFNRGLEQRVRLFQKAHGLEDDGVAGTQTLLALNDALNIDTSAQQARVRFQEMALTAGQFKK